MNARLSERKARALRAQRKERGLWFFAFGIVAVSLLFSQVMLQKASAPIVVAEALRPPVKNTTVQQSSPLASSHKNALRHRRLVVKEGDSLSSLFAREGISQEFISLLMSSTDARALKQLKPEQEIFLSFNESGELASLKTQTQPTSELFIKKQADHYVAKEIKKNQMTRLTHREAVIQSSLFRAAQEADIDDKLILALADIFAFDIDFASDIQPNDRFKIIYEEKYVEGKKVASGDILAAEFFNAGKVYRAIRFTDQSGQARYYSPDGMSLSQGFMRTPVKFSRISSTFQAFRRHPLLHTLRAHKGVDYAAPSGTAVRATADGVVAELGWKGGYGRTVVLRHGKTYSTLYGHLSGFAPGMKEQKHVKQGDIIGYVGSTGLATGPHLHYEFRVNGLHQNPLTVKLPKSLPIDSQLARAFRDHANKMTFLLSHPNDQIFASMKRDEHS